MAAVRICGRRAGRNGIGKYISDDDGRTWIAENGGNAGCSARAGRLELTTRRAPATWCRPFGTVDVAFLLYGTENISTYPTNNPMRGQSGAIVPFPCVSPNRPGKFHLTNSRTNVDTIAANAVVSPLNLSVYSMCGRFRAYRTSRATPRRFYAEVDAVDTSNRTLIIGLESSTGSGLGAGGAGRLHVFHRTSGGLVELWSDSVLDDTLWHTWLLRRIGLASWELYVDGVKQTGTNGSSSTSVSLDSNAVNKCIGNMPTTSGTPNQPSNCTQSNVHLCNGYAMTSAEAGALIDSATPPPSGTLTINWPLTAYPDSGNVVQVEAAAPQSVAIATAAEAETALAQAISLGIGIGAGTNTALTPAIALGIGVAAATNTALAQAISLGILPANDNETALAPGIRLGIAPAAETDTALALAPGGAGISPALETDTALARALVLGVSPATSSSAALAPAIRLGITAAAESDAALAVGQGGTTITPAVEANAALTRGIALGISPANDNETALTLRIKLGFGPAMETNSALVPGSMVVPPGIRSRKVARGSRRAAAA
jgi:hypothetical protein